MVSACTMLLYLASVYRTGVMSGMRLLEQLLATGASQQVMGKSGSPPLAAS